MEPGLPLGGAICKKYTSFGLTITKSAVVSRPSNSELFKI